MGCNTPILTLPALRAVLAVTKNFAPGGSTPLPCRGMAADSDSLGKIVQGPERPVPFFELPDARRTAEVRLLLRQLLVPRLRSRKFAGNFPHLYRVRDDRLDLFSIQFGRFSQDFVVELGRAQIVADERAAPLSRQQKNIAYCPLLQRARVTDPRRVGGGWAFHEAVCPDGLTARVAELSMSIDDILGERGEDWWRSESLEGEHIAML